MTTQEEQHKVQVIAVANQVKKFYLQKKKVRIYHGTTNSTRTQTFHKDAVVDISDLQHILVVNVEEKYAIVEPNVPMDQLVRETVKVGLVPPVVMEFPGITVGGGVQGGAGESSSFKYGGFHDTCLEYEIVLGDGTIVNASPKENADLYWGTACSYGSLGIITKVKITLISAKKYVLLRYNRIHSFSESVTHLEAVVKTEVDFIDSILFSKNLGTIMSGRLSDGKQGLRIATFKDAKDDWFYTHAEKITETDDTYEELIPLEDYVFRYNRGAFWVGRYVFQKLNIPFNRICRFLLDPFMHTRTLYRFLQAINISQRQIVQDLFLPVGTTVEFLEFIDTTTHIYPLWLLPGKLARREDKLSPGFLKTGLGIDVGVWGKVEGDYAQMITLNRDIEKILTKLGGRKVLYAHQYYPKKEFWEIYDAIWYRNLRKKYHAEVTFPDVYEKTYVKEQYAFSVLKGLLEVVKSPFRLPIS